MNRPRIMVLGALVVAALVVLPPQAAADITGVTVSPNPPIAGTPVIVTVTGTGFCTLALVNFGDDAPIGMPMALPMALQHIYRLPPGPKTITATGVGGFGCTNVRSVTVMVQPGRVSRVTVFPNPTNYVQGLGDKPTITISGVGDCGRIRVSFGDTWTDEISSIKTWPQFIEHYYVVASASEFPKDVTVKVEGVQECSGVASTKLALRIAPTRPVNVIQAIRPILPAGSTDFQLDQSVGFVVTGLGSCTKLRIDWGDGTSDDKTNVGLYTNPRYAHMFTGWGGGKTVTAIGVEGCLGRVNTRFKVEPQAWVLGYNIFPGAPNTLTCNAVPQQPPLVVPSIVHITTTAVTGYRGNHLVTGIDYGCPSWGCVYDANGKPGSSAGAPFPFLGMREYSLVLRVGTETFQGGTNVQFQPTQAAPLEICFNDNNMSDNWGGLVVHITVNQLGPPPPQ